MQPAAEPQISTAQVLTVPQQQELFISYCAMGGLITGDDMKITTMTHQDFADQIGVHPNTLTNWKKSIPDFAGKVRERRESLFPLARESAAWNRLYVIAMSSKDHKASVDALKTLLGHYSKLQLPVQRQDVKVTGSLAELMSKAEKEVLEGELVDNGSRSPAAV